MQNQSVHLSIGCNMQCRRGADTCSEENNRPAICLALQFIKGCKRGWCDALKSGWPSAAAETRIIHSPNFDRALVPHLGLKRNPSIGPVGIAIKAQRVRFRPVLLLSKARTSRPDFQCAVLKRNHSPDSAAGINRIGCRKENQLIRQVCEHDQCEPQTANTMTIRTLLSVPLCGGQVLTKDVVNRWRL